jgi:uncharacterized protein
MTRLIFCLLGFSLLLTTLATSGEPRIEHVQLSSHGDQLSGSVVSPAGQPPLAALVFVHGSGKQVRNLELAKRFADAGITALVYDKRGAGQSGGSYEGQQSVSGPNISLLADDAVAALQALQLRVPPNTRLGFAGISQAGWIAPLAAERSKAARFLLIWSGPVCKVSEEDIYSIHTRDTDSARPAAYAQALAARREPYIWPGFLGTDTDPSTSLAKLDIPGLWIFGGHDGSIPVDLSISRLQGLQRAGRPYQHLLHDGLGHNNMEATFGTATEWIRRLSR